MNNISVLVLFALFGIVVSYERDLTINVDPGKSDCFYQHIAADDPIEIEYQVIDGSGGSLDIAFVLMNPRGRVVVAFARRQTGIARTTATETGDYRFCFDNTHSTISSKTIYFDMLIANDEDSEEDKTQGDEQDASNEIENSLMETINRVTSHLVKARRLQESSSAKFARDDHASNRILSRVTYCSAYNAVAVFAIGALQVVLLRSLFDETSRVHGIWNKIPSFQS